MKAEILLPGEVELHRVAPTIRTAYHVYDVLRPSAVSIIQRAAVELKMAGEAELGTVRDTQSLLFRTPPLQTAASGQLMSNTQATASGTQPPPRRTTGGVVGEGEGVDSSVVPTPSVALLLEAAAQMSPLLSRISRFHGVGSCTAAREEGEDTVRRVLPLLRVVLLYCLATAAESAGASSLMGWRSRGFSGRDTPASGFRLSNSELARQQTVQPNTHVAASRGRCRGPTPGVVSQGGGRGWRQDPVADWLGHRMNPSVSTPLGGGDVSEEQLAEKLFSTAVEAMVAISDGEAGLQRALSSSPGVEGEGHSLVAELRVLILWLLTAVLLRFAGAQIDAGTYLPALFPDVDVQQMGCTRHPLLHTLLWAPLTSVRVAAAAVVEALLLKLQSTIQYVEEPKPRRATSFGERRRSFILFFCALL